MSAGQSLVLKPGTFSVTDGISGMHDLGSTHPSNVRACGYLVIGSTSFLRDHGLLTIGNYSVYWIFIPQPTGEKYKMCMIASRVDNNDYFAVTGEGINTSDLAKELMKALCGKPLLHSFRSNKMRKWFEMDLYKLPKISARDVLHLEPYKEK